MKTRLYQMMLIAFMTLLFLATATTAYASGDKERGDNAQGAAVQVQVQDPPPFQP